MRLCKICGINRTHVGWCDPCHKSYERAKSRDDGSILASLHWAAKRARDFARQKAKR